MIEISKVEDETKVPETFEHDEEHDTASIKLAKCEWEKIPTYIAELNNRIDVLEEMIEDLSDKLIPKYNSNESKLLADVHKDNSDSEPKYPEFTSIISLVRNKVFSSIIGSSLQFAGIKFVEDFNYVTIADLSTIPSLNRVNSDSGESILPMVVAIVQNYLPNSLCANKQNCPELSSGDLIRYIGPEDGNVEPGDVLQVVTIDRSQLLPKYTCIRLGDHVNYWVLSPCVIGELVLSK